MQASIYDIVVEKTEDGKPKINRINYEMEVLKSLRDKMRCKEIWIENACRYRNPENDLPKDFNEKMGDYFQLLKQPLSAEEFVIKIQKLLREALERFNQITPENSKVKIILKNMRIF